MYTIFRRTLGFHEMQIFWWLRKQITKKQFACEPAAIRCVCLCLCLIFFLFCLWRLHIFAPTCFLHIVLSLSLSSDLHMYVTFLCKPQSLLCIDTARKTKVIAGNEFIYNFFLTWVSLHVLQNGYLLIDLARALYTFSSIFMIRLHFDHMPRFFFFVELT